MITKCDMGPWIGSWERGEKKVTGKLGVGLPPTGLPAS